MASLAAEAENVSIEADEGRPRRMRRPRRRRGRRAVAAADDRALKRVDRLPIRQPLEPRHGERDDLVRIASEIEA